MIQGIRESLTDVMELAEAYANFNPTAYALIQAMTHLLPPGTPRDKTEREGF